MSNNGTNFVYDELINKIYEFDVSNNYYPRLYPDVSFSSANFPIFRLNNFKPDVAGTSASSPLFASIFAIINANEKRKYKFKKLNVDYLMLI